MIAVSNFLIIAGCSDIGLETAKQLIAKGHKVHISGRNENILSNLASTIGASFSVLDATDFQAVIDTFNTTINTLGAIDGVVNCAGSILLKSAHLTSQAEYEDIIKTNLTTAFAVVHAAGRTMTLKGGSVVLVSSAAAMVGLSNHEAIAAAKSGIIGLALSAAATYSNSHLRFNVVAPGLVETKLTQSITHLPAARKISEAMHPLGRLGTPKDIASAIVFFLEEQNNWITGQVLAVDGGLSHIRPKMKS